MQSNWCKLVSFCFLAHKRWMREDYKCTALKLICASVFVLCILKIAFLHYTYWLFLCACVFFHFFVHVYICMCLVATTYICVCLLLLTRYIQGAASPKDMLILVDAWVTTLWFIHYSQILFSLVCQKALMLTLWLASSRWALLRCTRMWQWQRKSSQWTEQPRCSQSSYFLLRFML